MNETIGLGCKADGDCPGSLVCFSSNLTWNKVGNSFCDCTTRYGWVMRDADDIFCLGFKASVYVTLVYTALLLLMYFLLGAVLFIDVYILLCEVIIPRKRAYEIFATVGILAFICVSEVVYLSFVLLTVASPSQNVLVDANGSKTSFGFNANQAALAVSVSLIVLAGLQISLVFYEVGKSSTGPEAIRRAIILRRIVFVLEAIFVTATLIDYIVFNFSNSDLICFPFYILIMILIARSVFQFEKEVSIPASGSAQEGKKSGIKDFILRNLRDVFSISEPGSTTATSNTNSVTIGSFEKRKAKLVREMKRACFVAAVSMLGALVTGYLSGALVFTVYCPIGTVLCVMTIMAGFLQGLTFIAVLAVSRFMHMIAQASISSVRNENNAGDGNQRREQQVQDSGTRNQFTSQDENVISWSGGTSSKKPFEPEDPSGDGGSKSHAPVQHHEPDLPPGDSVEVIVPT